MRTQESKVIDGMTFTVQQLPAMRALRLLNRLGRFFTPALASLVGGGGKLGQADVGALAAAAGGLFDRLSEDELERLTKDLLETATVAIDGKDTGPVMPQFDLLFQGKMGAVLKLLAFALQVNYSDFSDALGGLAKLAPGASGSKRASKS